MPRHGAPSRRSSRVRGTRRSRAPRLLLATVLIIVSVTIYVVGERRVSEQAAAAAGAGHAHFTDADAVAAVVSAAGAGVARIYTVDHRRFAADHAAGLAVVTGDYRATYLADMDATFAAQAARTQLVRTFAVQSAGISALSADGTQASAMIFGTRRDVTATSGAKGTTTALTVGVTLQRVGGAWLVSVLREGAGPQTAPPGNDALLAAVDAGRTETHDVLSYARATYPADVARAEAGATGRLRDAIRAGQQATLEAMTAQDYDLAGQIRGVAVESADGDTVTLLVCTDAQRVSGGRTTSITVLSRLRVVIEAVGRRWLAADLEPVTA